MKPFSDASVYINLIVFCFIIADEAGYLPWNALMLDKYFPNFLSPSIVSYCMCKKIKTQTGSGRH